MAKFFKLNLILGVVLLFASCATSMTPKEVNNTLPGLTRSAYTTQTQADEDVKANKCEYLVRGREYVVPIGITVKNELKEAAKGIDEWVELDGGNAYVLVSYKWVTVDHNNSTQLHVVFDTLLYK